MLKTGNIYSKELDMLVSDLSNSSKITTNTETAMLTRSVCQETCKICFDNEYKILKLERRISFCKIQCLKPSICAQSFNWIKIQTCKSQPGPKSPGDLLMSIILIVYCSGNQHYDFVRNTKWSFTWSVRALESLPSLLSNLVSKVRHITCTSIGNWSSSGFGDDHLCHLVITMIYNDQHLG